MYGKNIRYLREKHNMTQQDLANKFGYKSYTTIQHWENERAEPSIAVFRDLEEIFGVDALDIYTKDLEFFDADVTSEIKPLNKNEVNIIVATRGLNEEGFEELMQYAKYLLANEKYKKISSENYSRRTG